MSLDDPGGLRPSAPSPLKRKLYLALGALLVLAVVGFAIRRHRRMKRAHAAHKPHPTHVSSAAKPLPTASAPKPNAEIPSSLAMEIWVKNPEALAARVMPKLLGPAAAVKAMVPTFAMMLKNGMPEQSQKDIDELDLDKPLGYAILDDQGVVGARFVVAATVKDAARAVKVVEAYAVREGATKEHSTVLGIDTYKGQKTGRSLALYKNQVLLGSDKQAVEIAAPRLSAGWATASTQPHDVVARAPQSWVSGPFGKVAEKMWVDWSAPQLGGATSGPAKALFDDISSRAKSTWSGAEDLEVVLDVGDTSAVAAVALRATPNSALSQFLAAYPGAPPEAVLDAPRDALGAISLKFPPSWLEIARKFLVTPPPGVEIPEDLRTKTEAVFNQLSAVLEGELLLSSVADPPPNGGPGASLFRLKVRDEEGAKKAARELIQFIVAPGAPMTPLAVEGGYGEGMEFSPAPQPPQPPMPPVGIAWVVRNGYLYVARGASPKARVVRFASNRVEDHLGGDADVKARVSKLPPKGALTLVVAPLRADTPLAAGMGIAPLAQAITLGIEPTATALNVRAQLDLDLALQVLAPLLMRPQPGQPGAMPPGTLPPDAASGTPPPPGGFVPPTIVPPGMKPKPKPPGGPPGPAPTVVVPPAPTGYVLPLPKHQSSP